MSRTGSDGGGRYPPRRGHELGVEHGGVKDIGAGFILEFRDPDNIALELMAPTS